MARAPETDDRQLKGHRRLHRQRHAQERHGQGLRVWIGNRSWKSNLGRRNTGIHYILHLYSNTLLNDTFGIVCYMIGLPDNCETQTLL